jgi:hypothetical protein
MGANRNVITGNEKAKVQSLQLQAMENEMMCKHTATHTTVREKALGLAIQAIDKLGLQPTEFDGPLSQMDFIEAVANQFSGYMYTGKPQKQRDAEDAKGDKKSV